MSRENLIRFLKKNWKIIFAITYIVLPFDLVPDILPVIGVSDDLFILLLTLGIQYFEYRKSLKVGDVGGSGAAASRDSGSGTSPDAKTTDKSNPVYEGEVVDAKSK